MVKGFFTKDNMKKQGKEWSEAIIVAICLAVFVRTFFFQIYKIPTTSMVPTLKVKDKIFVSKLVYGPKIPFSNLRIPGLRKPRRAEVIVFIPPHDRKKHYIKRLIGLPGDKIRIRNGNIFVNGKVITDPEIANHFYYNDGEYAEGEKQIDVPEGEYFFLGDNSAFSQDSRFWGFVEEKDIVGKAIFIWWPLERINMIE